ncbi:MAG: hypothetical protein PVG49_03085 [Desulfobacteraceae bacterium]
MIDKQTKKKLRDIRKEIKKLKKNQRRMEFRPCKNDAELRKKERDLSVLRERISSLENAQDRCVLDSGGICHGG